MSQPLRVTHRESNLAQGQLSAIIDAFVTRPSDRCLALLRERSLTFRTSLTTLCEVLVYYILLFIVLALLGYLTVALLWPERF